MDYKEKYEQALERAKKLQKTCDSQAVVGWCEHIFPELKESEDERIRKELLESFKYQQRESHTDKEWLNGIKLSEVVAWLEKQGERKPVDKVEPKFHEGNWIISNNKKYIYQVIEVKRGIYVIRDNANNQEYHVGIEQCEKSGRLWTIQDAKDGDVLACNNGWTCIFKTLVNDETFSSYCFMDNTKWFCETGSECHTLKEEFVKAYNGKIYPATKEQRELLFTKMREAGYEWDAEKKELKKIEQNPQRMVFDYENANIQQKDFAPDTVGYKEERLTSLERKVKDFLFDFHIKATNGLSFDETMTIVHNLIALCKQEQKPVWSKEDEIMLNDAIGAVGIADYYTYDDKQEIENWLNSIKQRIGG